MFQAAHNDNNDEPKQALASVISLICEGNFEDKISPQIGLKQKWVITVERELVNA